MGFAVKSKYDVIVFGGGVAGVCAAIQSARTGASTLLVEREARLGGTLTNVGINFPGIFHAWGKQVIAGIGWNLVTRTVSESGGTLQDFTTPGMRHSWYQVRVPIPVFAAICDEEVLNSGADLLLHTMTGDAKRAKGGWRVTLCCKEGMRKTSAKMLVDCTGDANVAEMCGAKLRMYGECQPGTLCFRLAGYDTTGQDLKALDAEFAQAVDTGVLKATDAGWGGNNPRVSGLLSNCGNNANHIPVDSEVRTSEGRTRLEVEARASVRRIVNWLRDRPGLGGLHAEWVAQETGVRESTTVVGLVEITARDYASGRKWRDAVCNSFYPIDLHEMSGRGLNCVQLEPGVVPTVPRRALVAEGCEGLLMAGKVISSDRLAHSALRVQATCMATGQAAGAIAALAAQRGEKPDDVPIAEVRKQINYKAG